MKIVVDHRERNSGIIPELAKCGFDVDVKQLVIADYVLETKNLHGDILSVGVERKTMQDFLTSIVDKRLIAQLLEMKKHFSLALLILEGIDNLYELRDFHPNAIRGMLATVAVDLQVPILYTRNFRDTAAMLTLLAKRLEKERSFPSLVEKKRSFSDDQLQEHVLQSLPNIGPTLAKALLKKFKTIENVVNASVDDLMDVEKIGQKKADAIKAIVQRIYGK
ncbi:MAG: ERCC4 domain-containing protein [Nanoarchaeota archaeon]|nr:ERCC4 domain-containing protein [Nanoarchaeota archaeon]